MFKKPQRMKLRLPGKADRPGGGKGQRRLPHEGGRKPQRRGGLRLRMKLISVSTIDIGVSFLKGAVDVLRHNQAPIRFDRRLVCHGVLLCLVPAEGVDQSAVDHPVLRSDFRCCIPGLPACDSPRLQDHDLATGLLQRGGSQEPCDPRADNGDFRLDIAAQRLSFFETATLRPDGFHHRSSRSAAVRSFSKLSRARSVSMTGYTSVGMGFSV